MQILEEQEGDLLTVALQGHLDSVGAPSLEERLAGLIDAGVRWMIMDCGNLAYINSAGLKCFLVAAKQLEALAGKFIVCALPAHIAAVFATIGFDRILTVVPTRTDAAALLEGEARQAGLHPI